MDLVQHLVQQLGVSEDQAKGGAGLVLGAIKEKLGGNFSQITDAIPGADDLIQQAPSEEGGGGLMGTIGGLASKFGGGAGGLGALAGLAGGFDKLGLDASMITKFVPTLLEYVEKFCGEEVKELLSGFIPGGE